MTKESTWSKKPVVNQCQYDTATNCGAVWVHDFLKPVLKEYGMRNIVLYRTKATRLNFMDAVQNLLCRHVTGVGHGNDLVFAGQNQSIWIDTRKQEDVDLINDNVIPVTPITCKFFNAIEKSLLVGRGFTENFTFTLQGHRTFGDIFFEYERILWKEGNFNKDAFELAHELTYEMAMRVAQTAPSPIAFWIRYNIDKMRTKYSIPEPKWYCDVWWLPSFIKNWLGCGG